jgi:hypothetical protein
MSVAAAHSPNGIDENRAISHTRNKAGGIAKGRVLRLEDPLADDRANHSQEGSDPLVRLAHLVNRHVPAHGLTPQAGQGEIKLIER